MAYTTIDLPTDYFNTKLYTGTGSNNITLDMDNIGFLWMKRRNATGGHVVFDSVRGGHYTGSGAKPVLITNVTSAAQGTDIDSATKGINFGSTSTVIGSDSQGYNYNASGGTYVGWHWSGGSSTVSNTDGSITSSVSANTTAGFSIVSYAGNSTAGATVGHGLGSAPTWILGKNRTDADTWFMYHGSLGGGFSMGLNNTNAKDSNTGFWNSTAPSSTVFTLGNNTDANETGKNFIAYCFAEKQGYSKFGSYTGNGSTDGTYIHLGFKAAYIMIKGTGSGTNWFIQDNKRNPHNIVNKYFNADSNAADQSADMFDITANGIKQRNTFANLNGSGSTYIFMAFAENPFVSSGGIPTTAR